MCGNTPMYPYVGDHWAGTHCAGCRCFASTIWTTFTTPTYQPKHRKPGPAQ